VEIKDIRKGVFKDEVKSLSITSAEGEKFEFISKKFKPEYGRPTGFIIIGAAALLLVVIGFVL